MRLINLVHGELVVLGAYLALELTRRTGIDPLLTIVVVAPALFLLAAPGHRVLLEPLMSKGPEPALLTTFGLAIIAQNVFVLIWSGDTQALKAPYASSSIDIFGLGLPAMYAIS